MPTIDKKTKKIHDDLVVLVNRMMKLKTDILKAKTPKIVLIPGHKSDLADKRSVFYVTTGLFAAVTVGSTWMIIRNAKRGAPKFNDTERVKFDGLVWLPSDRGGYFMTGMHINLR